MPKGLDAELGTAWRQITPPGAAQVSCERPTSGMVEVTARLLVQIRAVPEVPVGDRRAARGSAWPSWA